MQVSGKPSQAFRLVQRRVARMQQVARGMIDIDQHRIEAAAWCLRIESIDGVRHREEIAMDQPAARIRRQVRPKRQQAALVPFDHLGQRIDHDERSHPRIFQHRLRGVTKPEPANDHIEVRSLQRRQSQPRQRNLRGREQARHQKLVAEFYFIDVDAGG